MANDVFCFAIKCQLHILFILIHLFGWINHKNVMSYKTKRLQMALGCDFKRRCVTGWDNRTTNRLLLL